MSRLEYASWGSQSVSMRLHGGIHIQELPRIEPEAADREHSSITSELSKSRQCLSDSLTDDSACPFPLSRPISSAGLHSTPGCKTTVHDSPERSSAYISSPVSVSQKYILFGGPGFSLGVLDCSSRDGVERLPVPLPLNAQESFWEHSFSEVLSVSLVGESQLWVGTESGSLHVFELTPNLKLTQPIYTTVNGPILCMAHRYVQKQVQDKAAAATTTTPTGTTATHAPRTTKLTTKRLLEIVVGTPSGDLTVIRGSADSSGRLVLKEALQNPRKVLQLATVTSSMKQHHSVMHYAAESYDSYSSASTTAACSVSCHCIVHVDSSHQDSGRGSVSDSSEGYWWCGCGTDIVILRNWEQIAVLDALLGKPQVSNSANPQSVMDLVVSDVGVWSFVSWSSTVVLWDTAPNFSQKMKVTCCQISESSPYLDGGAQVTAIHFAFPLLFIGTNGGHLMVFSIDNTTTNSSANSSAAVGTGGSMPNGIIRMPAQPPPMGQKHRLLTATNCGPHPIVTIHSSTTQMGFCRSPTDSPLSTPSVSQQVLVVCGSQLPPSYSCDRTFDGEEDDSELEVVPEPAASSLLSSSSSQCHLFELFSPSSPKPSPHVSPCSLLSSSNSTLSLRPRTITGHHHHQRKLSLQSASRTAISFLPLT